MKKLSLCTIWIIGCGPAPLPKPDLTSHLSSWKEDAKIRGYSSDILSKFEFQDELKFLEAGRCIPETRTILISKQIWFKMDDTQRMILIYHEMGHCELGRPDNNELMKDKPIPASLMYPILLSSRNFLENKKYYIDELFNRQN